MNDVLIEMMDHLSKRGTMILLMFFLAVYVISSGFQFQYYLLESGILLYLIGIYIKKYHQNRDGRVHLKYLWVTIVFWGLYGVFMSKNAVLEVGEILSIRDKIYQLVLQMSYGMCTFICAIAIFLFFCDLRVGFSERVNKIASLAFGIYLMHDSIFGRIVFWDYVLRIDRIYNSVWFPIITFFLVILCFCVFGGIDWLRQRFVMKRMDSFGLKIIGKLCRQEKAG